MPTQNVSKITCQPSRYPILKKQNMFSFAIYSFLHYPHPNISRTYLTQQKVYVHKVSRTMYSQSSTVLDKVLMGQLWFENTSAFQSRSSVGFEQSSFQILSFLCFLSLLTLLISVRVLLLVCAGIIRKRQIVRYTPVVIFLSFEIF